MVVPTNSSMAPMRSAQTGFEGDRRQCIECLEQYICALPLSHLVFEFVVAYAEDLTNCFQFVVEEVLPELHGFDPV